MLFIIGSTNMHKEVKEIDFKVSNCPNCGESLKIVEVSRWFTLFFVRMIKTGTEGYYYICPVCGKEFSSSEV